MILLNSCNFLIITKEPTAAHQVQITPKKDQTKPAQIFKTPPKPKHITHKKMESKKSRRSRKSHISIFSNPDEEDDSYFRSNTHFASAFSNLKNDGQSNILKTYALQRQNMKSHRIITLENAVFTNEQKLASKNSPSTRSGVTLPPRAKRRRSKSLKSKEQGNEKTPQPMLSQSKKKMKTRDRERLFERANPRTLKKMKTQNDLPNKNRFGAKSKRGQFPSQLSLFGNHYQSEKPKISSAFGNKYGTGTANQIASFQNTDEEKNTNHEQFMKKYHQQEANVISFKQIVKKDAHLRRRSQHGSSIISQFMRGETHVSQLVSEQQEG